jgi:hypothetical protein
MTANLIFSKAYPKPAEAKTRMRMLRTLTQAFFFIVYRLSRFPPTAKGKDSPWLPQITQK